MDDFELKYNGCLTVLKPISLIDFMTTFFTTVIQTLINAKTYYVKFVTQILEL